MSEQKSTDIPATEIIVDTAMTMVAADGWAAFTIDDLARRLDVDRDALARHYPARLSVLDALLRLTDADIVENMDPGLRDEPVRDRIFELVMLRFDAMGQWKDGIARMVRDLPRDPVTTAALAALLGRSFASMLEAAGQGFSGLGGAIRMNGLGVIYLAAVRVWLQDDSPDLSRTMSELDRRLTQADLLLRRFLSLSAADGAVQN